MKCATNGGICKSNYSRPCLLCQNVPALCSSKVHLYKVHCANAKRYIPTIP